MNAVQERQSVLFQQPVQLCVPVLFDQADALGDLRFVHSCISQITLYLKNTLFCHILHLSVITFYHRIAKIANTL